MKEYLIRRAHRRIRKAMYDNQLLGQYRLMNSSDAFLDCMLNNINARSALANVVHHGYDEWGGDNWSTSTFNVLTRAMKLGRYKPNVSCERRET